MHKQQVYLQPPSMTYSQPPNLPLASLKGSQVFACTYGTLCTTQILSDRYSVCQSFPLTCMFFFSLVNFSGEFTDPLMSLGYLMEFMIQ